MRKISVSTLMDGEEISRSTLQNISRDPKLERCWQRFHLIRDVMRNESDFILDEEFTKRVATALEDEVSPILTSQPSPQTVSFVRKFKPIVMPLLQFGIAAGVCLIAVFGVQRLTENPVEKDIPVLQTLPFNNQVQEVAYKVPEFVVTPKQVEEKNKQIDEIIQGYELQRRLYASEIRK